MKSTSPITSRQWRQVRISAKASAPIRRKEVATGRERRAYLTDSEDGVAVLEPGFEPRGFEVRPAGAGQLHHAVAVLVGRAEAGFVGRARRRHEQHARKVERAHRLPRDREMGVVHGIERAAEKSQAHGDGYFSSLISILRKRLPWPGRGALAAR